MYKNELADEQKEQERYLKDDYDRYMEELSRPAAQLEMKYRAPKHLAKRAKFIQIWPTRNDLEKHKFAKQKCSHR